jgi:hypothetical protein
LIEPPEPKLNSDLRGLIQARGRGENINDSSFIVNVDGISLSAAFLPLIA